MGFIWFWRLLDFVQSSCEFIVCKHSVKTTMNSNSLENPYPKLSCSLSPQKINLLKKPSKNCKKKNAKNTGDTIKPDTPPSYAENANKLDNTLLNLQKKLDMPTGVRIVISIQTRYKHDTNHIEINTNADHIDTDSHRYKHTDTSESVHRHSPELVDGHSVPT